MNLRTLMFLKAASGGGPALEEKTAVGNPAVFTAQVAKALKSLIVQLSCSQSGSGDPSPANPRPFSGVSGVTVYHSGEDTQNPDEYTVSFSAPGMNLSDQSSGIELTDSKLLVVYGGTLDVVSGVLTITYAECKTTWGAGTNSKVFTVNERRRMTLPFTCVGATSSITGVCNVASWDWDYEKDSSHFYNHNGYSYVFLPVGTDDSTEIQIVGKLAAPVTVQLTPEQIAAFIGTNRFWVDTPGELSVVYLDKRKGEMSL